MAFSARDVGHFVPKVLLSICISAGITALLIRLTLASAETTLWPGLIGALSNVTISFVLVYIVVSIIRTALQARRYRLLLLTSEKSVPSLFHILLVTLSRNMFVDMLPSRLGELSYLAMLNRGYQIRISSGVSSMVICFVFDLIALSLLILILISVRAMGEGGQSWMLGVLISLIFLILVFSIFLFPVFAWINNVLSRISSGKKRSFDERKTIPHRYPGSFGEDKTRKSNAEDIAPFCMDQGTEIFWSILSVYRRSW